MKSECILQHDNSYHNYMKQEINVLKRDFVSLVLSHIPRPDLRNIWQCYNSYRRKNRQRPAKQSGGIILNMAGSMCRGKWAHRGHQKQPQKLLRE